MDEKKIKALEASDLEIKSVDEKNRIIWHTISKEVKDRMGDIVRIDGIDLKRFKKKPGVLADHNYYGGNPVPVIAEGIGFKKEGKSLYAGTKFFDPGDEEMSQGLKDLSGDHFALHKMKLLGWSIGFIPRVTETMKDKEDNLQGYDYKESELLEYSSVIIPANQEAIDDAFHKGLITKEFTGSLPKKEEKLPGELAEEVLTDADIGKIAEDKRTSVIYPKPKEEKSKEPEKPAQQGIMPDLIQALIEIIKALNTIQKKIADYLQKFQDGGKKHG